LFLSLRGPGSTPGSFLLWGLLLPPLSVDQHTLDPWQDIAFTRREPALQKPDVTHRTPGGLRQRLL
jgi:hypothetical protein